jgi:hypothetical protein
LGGRVEAALLRLGLRRQRGPKVHEELRVGLDRARHLLDLPRELRRPVLLRAELLGKGLHESAQASDFRLEIALPATGRVRQAGLELMQLVLKSGTECLELFQRIVSIGDQARVL